MSRVPATLLYLTIYNPSLQPTGPIPEDDEDAEEQAHILFYTSRERAVSRDRMLRQVGLAKALVNFSEMFNVQESCSNVHSQSKRMIMIEPESDFWIHAGIEVAKTPKPLVDKGRKKDKGKGKGKETQSQENEKDKENGTEELVYDYHDASVHDLALRTDILRAYERFKLIHGSFTSVLTTLGKEALELQLERFFTVWAWSWNLDDGHEFGLHLGIPLHPSCRSLTALLDAFSSQLPEGSVPFIISPSFLIPSARYIHARYPPILSRYLMSLIPSSPSTATYDRISNSLPDSATAEEGTVNARQMNGLSPNNFSANGNGLAESPSTFLGMPAMNMNMNVNMNMNMDVRKWGWPGYLTFGRNSGKKPPDAVEFSSDGRQETTTTTTDGPVSRVDEEPANVDVDKDALEDAMSSDNVSILVELAEKDSQFGEAIETRPQDIPPGQYHQVISGKSCPTVETQLLASSTHHSNNSSGMQTPPVSNDTSSSSTSVSPLPSQQTPTIAILPVVVALPKLLSINVYLAESDDTLVTRKQKVYYIIKHRLAVAVAGLDAENYKEIELSALAEKALSLLNDVETALDEEAGKIAKDSIQSATNILESKDRHIVSVSEMTISSPGFKSKSEHLYNTEQLFEKDPHILEVFSRGQNPQHWHVGKRGLGAENDGVVDGEIYVEVSRKETSITDVDNVVALLLHNLV